MNSNSHTDGALLERRLVANDGTSLSWYQQSQAGINVLFQHGLGGDHLQCQEVFPPTERFRMNTLECRGHGASGMGASETINMPSFANDLIQLIESNLNPPVVLGGISMGAALSLRVAAMRPDLVRALILVRPAWAFDAGPSNMLPMLSIGQLLTEHSVDDARTEFMRSDIYAQLQGIEAEELTSLMGFFDRPDARRFGQVLQAISEDGPGINTSSLESWQIPTRVMASRDDYVHPVSLAEILARQLNAGEVVHLAPRYIDKHAHTNDLGHSILAFLQTLNLD